MAAASACGASHVWTHGQQQAAISGGHLGLHGVAQFGGVIAIGLAVNQHQGKPLVVFNDVGYTAEILDEKQKHQKHTKRLNKVLLNKYLVLPSNKY